MECFKKSGEVESQTASFQIEKWMQNVKTEAKYVDLKEMRKEEIQRPGEDIQQLLSWLFLHNMCYKCVSVWAAKWKHESRIFMLFISLFIIVNITTHYDKKVQPDYQIVLYTVIQGIDIRYR